MSFPDDLTRTTAILTPFQTRYAESVASWVQSDRELLWLAPATVPPITPQKVIEWGAERRRRFLFWADGDGRETRGTHDASRGATPRGVDSDKKSAPAGYAELNEMPDSTDQFWIGHFILDPALRGRGLGTTLAQALVVRAFVDLAASDVLLVVFPDNTGAIRCYERAGLVTLGKERKYFEATGREHLLVRMGIHRARYLRLAADGQLPDHPLPIR